MSDSKPAIAPEAPTRQGSTTPGPGHKLPYVRPRVEAAGSVFERTRALGAGNKDIINGSSLL